MDAAKKYRMRVESCIGAIIDVQESIDHLHRNAEFLSRFKKIKLAIDNIDMKDISEQDVRLVEQATNALLGEFKPLFDIGDNLSVYQTPHH
jgi:hypothetical protein